LPVDTEVGDVELRDATEADLPGILALSNAGIRTTTAAWTDVPETMAWRRAWFADRRAAGDCVLVAVEDGDVIGFCAWGGFRDGERWPGYRFTAEHSIHVRSDRQGRGVGRALLTALVERAGAAGLHVLVAAIDGDNAASIAFHRALGFEVVARMPEVGRKFDRWLDLVLVQRTIGQDRPVDDDVPCPECATPVPARPTGPTGLLRGSCTGCGLQLVRRDGEGWREIRG
jgi:phosphinothricin acetyltransferase